jgi:manganese-dependent ADP-ribose/CDP-alcohol diphosphatase
MSPTRLAVIADVQYGNKPDHEERRYRSALGHLGGVLAGLPRVEGLIQLGDLIDGYREDPAASAFDLEAVLAPLEARGQSLWHVVGNHDLRVGRSGLLARLGLDSAWYSLGTGGWRVIVLDTMQVSAAGRAPDEPEALAGEAWQLAHPVEEHPRARVWNGAVDVDQLEWLEGELAQAQTRGEPVLALGHHPLRAEASLESYLCWNAEEVAEVLEGSPATVAYLAGHDHAGGYARMNGVHHLTLPAVLDGPNGVLLQLEPECLRVTGIGAAPDRVLTRP